MHKDGYYTSGEFAKKAQVSVRTVRFYDKQNILRPSLVDEHGARYYTDSDFAKLQQILLLKYLGFALEDIREMTIAGSDYRLMLNSLRVQKRLFNDKMEQMLLVGQAIDNSIASIEANKGLDGDTILNLIHLTGMENTMKAQYQNASNISARIRLHREYSVNPQGWFPWIFDQLKLQENMQVLEVGCGSGALWQENASHIPDNIHITLTDISEGMVRELKRSLGRGEKRDKRFSFATVNCEKLPYEDNSFDLVIANHVLFYCDDITRAISELARVLRPGGRLVAATYGAGHMKEITTLVQGFDEHITLSSGENLYDRFGLENGEALLMQAFAEVTLERYEDEIVIDSAEPLIEYILSCHGNQSQYLVNRYRDFKLYVERNLNPSFHITKEAGIFVGRK